MNDLEKLYQDKNWLILQYWGFNMSASEIARTTGCSKQGILYWMRKYNIPRGREVHPYFDKKWLNEQYWDFNQSMRKMAISAGCSKSSINNWMKFYKIPTRQAKISTSTLHKNSKWLTKRHLEYGMNAQKISKLAGCSRDTILKYLRKYGIPIKIDTQYRKRADSSIFKDINWLTEMYWGFDFTRKKLAELGDCSDGAIQYWMKKYKIPMDFSRGIKKGEEHSQWKGGYYPYYGHGWSKAKRDALKRSQYRSELSGNNGSKIEVHHIIPTRKIIQKYIDLCLKPYIKSLDPESFRVLPWFLIPDVIFNVINDSHNLIVLTKIEHLRCEGLPPSYFANATEILEAKDE